MADACRKTIRTLMKNSIENVENQILSVLEDVGAKMAPNIERFLFEGQVHCSTQTDRRALLQYLDENLVFLKHRLVAANYERVLSVMWAVSSNSLSDILHKSIEKKKSPKFFVSLHETFKILLNFFYGDKIPQDGGLQSTKRLLELFSAEPAVLVQSYYRQRFADFFCCLFSGSPSCHIFYLILPLRIFFFSLKIPVNFQPRMSKCNCPHM